MKYLLSLLFLFYFMSCGIDKTSDKNKMPDSFRSFINKFKPVKLPLTISIYSITVKDLIQVDDKSSDTLYIKGNESIYEILNDTTDFYYLITCQPADAYVPILNIYNKKGEKLSSESLVVRGCGGGPGIEYCSSTAIIKKIGRAHV